MHKENKNTNFDQHFIPFFRVHESITTHACGAADAGDFRMFE